MQCSECDRPRWARGYCNTHYKQWRRVNPGAVRPRVNLSPRPTHASAHGRCYSAWGSASQHGCVKCGGPAQDWAYDGTDPAQLIERTGQKAGQIYSAWPEFYMPMCRLCHKGLDAAKAKAELLEYRLWKFDTGLTLQEVSNYRLQHSA